MPEPTPGTYQFDPDTEPDGPEGLPPYPKDRVVRNIAQLQALIPDYEGRSFNEILGSPLFTGPNAYQLSPDFTRELYSALLQIEGGTGVSIGDFASQVPAGVLGSKSALNRLLDATDGGGGGPSRVGVQAPDPYGAALIRFKHYDSLIERGDITAEDAADAWQRDFDEITANSRIAAERVAAEQRLQDTATRRGELQFDILRSSLPEGTSLSLGPAGVVPSNVVNMQDILSQGLPSLPEQYASIGEQLQPITGLPPVAPRELPPASLLDPMLGLADKTAAGSMGFLV